MRVDRKTKKKIKGGKNSCSYPPEFLDGADKKGLIS
jgi:hypothetical protein